MTLVRNYVKKVKRNLVMKSDAMRRYNATWTSPPIIRRVHRQRLSFLDVTALTELWDSVRKLEESGIDGAIIEAGCALGGSALVMASAKSREREMYIYDTFATIPPPTSNDDEDAHSRYKIISSGRAQGFSGEVYYGYKDNLEEDVRRRFESEGLSPVANKVNFVRGRFEDTLNPGRPVALAHIDGDWYSSVATCLNNIAPCLVPGGRFVIDDYEAWSGCRKAVDEYFREVASEYDFVQSSRLHIIKRTS